MTQKNGYKSDLSEAEHSSAAILNKMVVLDEATMRDFDTRHLAVSDQMNPVPIKRLRISKRGSIS